MDQWNPRPLNKPDVTNDLFQMDESVTITKSIETPIQRQRRLDGTPHTVGGPSALRPQGPELSLDGLSKSFTMKDKKETCDPDEVLKAYLSKED